MKIKFLVLLIVIVLVVLLNIYVVESIEVYYYSYGSSELIKF